MIAAAWPREAPLEERLLVVDVPARAWRDAQVADLESLLRPGDLLIANDAATAPALLEGRGPRGAIEARLAGELFDGTFRAILFGPGNWRMRTEDRPPAEVHAGDRLRFGPLAATVETLEHGRLATLRFDARGSDLWTALYAHGRPIQYSYLRGNLPAWHAQTRYGARPWAMESPSAGRPLTFALLGRLARRGVGIHTLTHAAGLSSTGDPAIDARLPFPERFDIPARTAAAIAAARGRVVAVGTTVVRALEGCAAAHGAVVAGEDVTDLRLGPETRLRVVDGILTGMHEPGTSHFDLLRAFADAPLLEDATRHAEAQGYLGHEFGDSMLLLSR